MNIKVLTDTGSCIDKKMAENLGVRMLPVIITENGESYYDGEDIEADLVYRKMREGSFFKTSQIPMQQYVNYFEEYAKEQIPIVYVCMSTGLSSTYNTALIAANEVREKYKDAKIGVIDSKLCAYAQGVLVEKICQMAEENKSFEQMQEITIKYQNNMYSAGFVDDMNYLSRGGRIPKSVAILGGALNIKPFIYADLDGRLQPFDKMRGKKKALKKMVDLVEEKRIDDIKDFKIYLSHTDNYEDVAEVEEMMKVRYNLKDKDFINAQVSATIGAHTGPGSMFMFFFKKDLGAD